MIAARGRRRRAPALRRPARGRFVPVCARYPYEVWIAPSRAGAVASPTLDRAERRDLARALKTVLLKFDGLWSGRSPT